MIQPILTDAFIQAFQNSKKHAIDALVKNEALAETFHQFVDAQTAYTKSAAEASFSAGTALSTILSKKEFWTDSLKGMQDAVFSFTQTQKRN